MSGINLVESDTFTKNEVTLVAVLLNLLEAWAQNYMGNQFGEVSAEDVVKNFNEAALPVGMLIGDLIMEHPQIMDLIDKVLEEAREAYEVATSQE